MGVKHPVVKIVYFYLRIIKFGEPKKGVIQMLTFRVVLHGHFLFCSEIKVGENFLPCRNGLKEQTFSHEEISESVNNKVFYKFYV